MRIGYILLIFSVLMSSGPARSQYYNQQENFMKANSIWIFGDPGTGLDFNSGRPVPIPVNPLPYQSYGSSSSVCDSAGQLLFYVTGDGIIYNRNQVPMTNGTGLVPNSTIPGNTSLITGQPQIVPVIDTPWKYYVFSTSTFSIYWNVPLCCQPPYIFYSVVDMTLDNGLGAVQASRKNLPLYNYGIRGNLITVPGDQCDIWLLAQTSRNVVPNILKDPGLPANDSEYILAWHITAAGIDPVPVLSASLSKKEYYFGTETYLRISPDRKHLAVSEDHAYIIDTGLLFLYKFDPLTGKATDGISFKPGEYSAQNLRQVCFSPDNTKLYLACGSDILFPQPIIQYDVSIHNPAAILASEYVVAMGMNYALRLYNDTIYTAERVTNTLGRINNPNASGAACAYQSIAINLLPSTNTVLSFPPEVVYPVSRLGGTSLVYDTLCYMADTGYTPKKLTAPSGYYSYKWSDGSRGKALQINKPGTYWVRYENMCYYYLDTFIVTSTTPPEFSLGEDTTFFCRPAEMELNVDIPGVSYHWQDGSTANNYPVTEAGTYWVEVGRAGCLSSDTIEVREKTLDMMSLLAAADTTVCEGELLNIVLSLHVIPAGAGITWGNGSTAADFLITAPGVYTVKATYPSCIFEDSVQVFGVLCDCAAQMPTAFSPNGDGHNDVYRPVIQKGCAVVGYVFTIYNRWGEQVYATDRPFAGWDGYYKGQPAELGTYSYRLSFIGGTHGKQHDFKGDVTLIR